jgi:hypothetical protein
MDRDILERQLTKAEQHVVITAQNVARQRELVAQLERDGHDASQAQKMLEQFLKQQALHIADRDRFDQRAKRITAVPLAGAFRSYAIPCRVRLMCMAATGVER